MGLFKVFVFFIGAIWVAGGLFADHHNKCSCKDCKCEAQEETCGCDKNCDHCKEHSSQNES